MIVVTISVGAPTGRGCDAGTRRLVERAAAFVAAVADR